MSDKFHVGKDLVSYADNGKYKPVSRVTLMLDNDNCITAGDDTGLELVADCPFATQEMAEILLASFAGYVYKAYEAVAANINPSAELGDGLTADSNYVVISRIDDDGTGYPTLSAPGEAEMEDEYPSLGPQTQQFNRQLAQARSLISKTAEEIRLEVFGEDGPGDESLRSEIAVELSKITLAVAGKIDGEQAQTLIDQSLEKIELSVTNGSTSSTISLKAGETVIDSASISFSGFVTYTGLSGGTTTIDGACIKTGTIAADRLNLSGAISFGDLTDSDDIEQAIEEAQDTADYAYDVAADAAYDAYVASNTVSSWCYGSTTYIDGSKIMTGTVQASYLKGGSISIMNSKGTETATMTPGLTTAAGLDITSRGNLYLNSEVSGHIGFDSTGGFFQVDSGLTAQVLCGNGYMTLKTSVAMLGTSYGRFQINSDAAYVVGSGTAGKTFCPLGTSLSLGKTDYGIWSALYASSSTIITSDRNRKNSIEDLPEKYLTMLDAIAPQRFKLNDGSSGRYHIGFIAQDVEEAMTTAGIDTQEFGGFVRDVDTDGNEILMLRYEEFIGILHAKIKQLESRLAVLEG